MDTKQKEFSSEIQCRHCLNSAPMEIVARFSQIIGQVEDESCPNYDITKTYQILKCPACYRISFIEFEWCDAYMDPADGVQEVILYPCSSNSEMPLGLPDRINKALTAAQKVKNIDTNAFAVLLGRVLEMVCKDRNANGKYLADQLHDLAKKGEIPEKLVIIARKLKDFRNIGAHASLGELTKDEIPILDALCNAVLEYVYSAPYLVNQAKKHFDRLREKA